MTQAEHRAEVAITRAIKAAQRAGAPKAIVDQLVEAKAAMVAYRSRVEQLRDAA